MAAEIFCEPCALPRAMCLHGLADREQEARDQLGFWGGLMAVVEQETGRIGPLIEAQYSGWCPGCGERWEPGDLIGFDDEQGKWICAGCAEL